MRFRIRLIFLVAVVVVFIAAIFIFSIIIQSTQNSDENSEKSEIPEKLPVFDIDDDADRRNNHRREEKEKEEDDDIPNYDVHTFYYPWYGNPSFDNGSYYHWNHNILPGPPTYRQSPTDRTFKYEPPDEIGADFYPQLGCYSSRDPAVVRQHFRWIRGAGIGTVVISWYPPGQSTDQGHPWDDLVPSILDAAYRERLKVAFQIEPYKNRNVDNLRTNLAYILSEYGSHPAFYRYRRRSKSESSKPLIYIYDSYLIPDSDWKSLLTIGGKGGGKSSIRRTLLDSYIIGLLIENKHKTSMASAGFDGFYTYFAVDGFTFGSTWRNWRSIAHSARKMNMIFIPCVGPGYTDKSIRPWNERNTKSRGSNGAYYAEAWSEAVNSGPDLLGITSFNEWHEGTQIEPAVPKTTTGTSNSALQGQQGGRTYLDYSPTQPDYYLQMTAQWVLKFTKGTK